MRWLRARRSVVPPPSTPRKAFRVSCAWGMPQRGWSWLLVTTPRGGFICRIPLPRGQPGEVSPDVLRGTASPGHAWLPSCLCARNQPRFRAGGSGCPRCRWDWRPEMPRSRCRAVRVWLPPPPGQWREVQLSASCAPVCVACLPPAPQPGPQSPQIFLAPPYDRPGLAPGARQPGLQLGKQPPGRIPHPGTLGPFLLFR